MFSSLDLNSDDGNKNEAPTLSPSEKHARGLELITSRGNIEEQMTDENLKDLSENRVSAAHLIMAMLTVNIAECGIYEEEKHMSLVYAEEHSDTMFGDGGKKLFGKLSMARISAIIEDLREKLN